MRRFTSKTVTVLALGALAAAAVSAVAISQTATTAPVPAEPVAAAAQIGPIAPGLVPLAPQPAGVAWPTQAWPTGTLPPAAQQAITAELDRVFASTDGPLGETRAIVIIQNGRLVLERYGAGWTADSQLVSWSMAKSVTAALAGIMVGDGKISLDSSIAPPQWREGDRRRAITLAQALHMADGLAWNEIDYADVLQNDAAKMLFGEGRENIVAYVARKGLRHDPGTTWNYSSGTTNLISAALSRALGPRMIGDSTGREQYRNFMVDRLFRKIGMRSIAPEFDAAGNLYASSLIHATARDWAKFGYLHLRDGVWDGDRILPEGWVDFSRSPTTAEGATEYAGHWWLSPANREGTLKDGPYDTFEARGYQGQRILVIPSKDAVIVRLGLFNSEGAGGEALGASLQTIVSALPDRPATP
jgi:CubicO group peptidase (beta-lactamase class C family)